MDVATYGSWVSPITSDLITRSTIRLSSIVIDDSDIYWLESRPLEGGRSVIVRKSADGQICDMTPAPFNVRSLAHEYGGGAYTVKNGVIYFCNYEDQRIYRQAKQEQPQAITATAKVYYADLFADLTRNRLICVQEDHTEPGQEALTTLVSISLQDGSAEMLIAGNDFYATPRLNAAGTFMSWISWNHPNMPWDESCLWVGNVGTDGCIGNVRKIAGGSNTSVFQPQWSPGGELYYICDQTGWWNIYRHSDYEETQTMAPMPAEFGLPQWVFGMSTYDFESDQHIVSTFCQNGTWHLGLINTVSAQLEKIDLPFTDFSGIKANNRKAYFLAGSPTQCQSLIEMDLTTKQCKSLRHSSELTIDQAYLSQPETIIFSSTAGRKAHAFYYPPYNRDFQAPASELPPLIVKSHGGPTGAASSTLSLGIQYWTSRGFAVVDVNYGGSTGFGREYRNYLYDSWGIVDVDDCVNAARHLVALGRVDEQRLAIAGGSAGGYTTLCALTFHDTFKAGASHYGVSDLEALATDTHKFESRYLDRLVGAYPAARQVYYDRSPINFAKQLNCPVIFLQGLEDKVVPPNQSETMVNALKDNGVPVAYVTFAGEQHGFRKAENIKKALDSELYFYAKIFHFNLPEEDAQKIAIHNL